MDTAGSKWRRRRWCAAACVLIVLAAGRSASHASARTCRVLEIDGEVQAGKEWRASIGEGWVFRVLPVQPGSGSSSGWDLVVDREPPAGYPDALLLATPPYNSLNEREVGTTYGVRAQDAIGWNPRSFRFVTDVHAFHEGQQAFLTLQRAGAFTARDTGKARSPAEKSALDHLLRLQNLSAAGEFRIVDAALVPGVVDPAPYAEAWARASGRTPHTTLPAKTQGAAPLGSLAWIKFTVRLWLPEGWRVPAGMAAKKASCPDHGH